MRKLAVPARAITSFSLLVGLSISCSGEGNQTQATDAPAIFDPRFQDIRDLVVQEVADGNSLHLQ